MDRTSLKGKGVKEVRRKKGKDRTDDLSIMTAFKRDTNRDCIARMGGRTQRGRDEGSGRLGAEDDCKWDAEKYPRKARVARTALRLNGLQPHHQKH